MRDCLRQFGSGEGTVASICPKHHRLTLQLCDPSSEMYPERIRFCQGESLADLPALRCNVAPFKFVILTEASAERNHSVVEHGIALRRYHTEPFFSLVVRIPYIYKDLEERDDVVLQLAEHCASIRDPERLMHEFNLVGHPSVQRALQEDTLPGWLPIDRPTN